MSSFMCFLFSIRPLCLYCSISISRTSVYWLATVPSFFVSPVPTLCPHNLSDSFLPFLLVILWKRKEKGRIVCKVRTQQAENFDEEVKSLVSAWRALHLCLSFSTRQEDNRRPPMTLPIQHHITTRRTIMACARWTWNRMPVLLMVVWCMVGWRVCLCDPTLCRGWTNCYVFPMRRTSST